MFNIIYTIGSQRDLKVPFKILIKCSLCELEYIDSELNTYPLSAR